MKKKYDDMSTLMIKKFENQNNNNINLSSCRTVHNGIKCEKCFKEPIVGFRYKCSICNNYNLCQDCEEKNAQTGEHEHDFIKIRKVETLNRNTIINNQNNFNAHNLNINNDNNDFELFSNNEKEYSYECLNKNNLVKEVEEGTKETSFNVVLRNNKNIKWPMNNTKLSSDLNSNVVVDDVYLEPQDYNEQKDYIINVRDIDTYPPGEYKMFLSFEVNGERFGEQIFLKLIIKKKQKEDNEDMKKIKEFRGIFGLEENDHSDDKLLKALKENNYNFEEAFSSLFN